MCVETRLAKVLMVSRKGGYGCQASCWASLHFLITPDLVSRSPDNG
jgi:hypothetical protein